MRSRRGFPARISTTLAAVVTVGAGLTGCTSTAGTARPIGSTSSPMPSRPTTAGATSTDSIASGAITSGAITSDSTTSGSIPSGATAPGTSPAVGPSSRVVLAVTVTGGGSGTPDERALGILVAALRRELKAFPGATVAVTTAGTVVVRAPTTDLAGLRAALVVPSMTVRPVSATWMPSSSAGGPFPAGSDPASPNQPTIADTDSWQSAVAGYSSDGSGPSCREITAQAGHDDAARPLLACNGQGDAYLLEPAILTGAAISAATAVDDTRIGWTINATLTGSGLDTWSHWTAVNIGRQVAFVVNGAVISAPSVQQAITTATTMISGSFTKAEATNLADLMTFASLPLAVTVTEATTVR